MSKSSKTVDILVVEDDSHIAFLIKESLQDALYAARIRLVRTEFEFCRLLPAIRAMPPDIVILDMMIRWTDPSPNMETPPEDVMKDGHFRAGLRCFRRLQQAAETEKTPVIFYSVLERPDVQAELRALPPHVLYLSKSITSNEQLVTYIRSLVAYLPEPPAERRGFLRRAFEATEAKPEWLGISIDLKKLLRE